MVIPLVQVPDAHAPPGSNSATARVRASEAARTHAQGAFFYAQASTDRFLICLSLGIGVGARLGVSAWLGWIDEPLHQRSSPLADAQADQAPATVSAEATVLPTKTTSGEPLAQPRTPPTDSQRRVTNTDGQGVALRASPGGDRLPGKGYEDGQLLTVLEQQGEWTHIRGADGRDGWVLSVTLGP